MVRNLRSVLLRKLTESPFTNPFLQIFFRFWPFFIEIRDARKSALDERNNLEHKRIFAATEGVVVRFDDRHCFPGMGDLFIVIMLANYLHDIGFKVTFSYSLGGDTVNELSKVRHLTEREQLISNFVRSGIDTKKSSSITDEELSRSILRNRISGQRDITGPSLYLLSLIYLSKTLNPSGIPPLISRDMESGPSHTNQPINVGRIGFHVRSSNENVFRNPKLSSVLSDFLVLRAAFPRAEILWFGEKVKFDEFLLLLAEGRTFTTPPLFQKSHSFPEAVIEALSVDFWYQRFGGGIGAISLFSTLPYLILSADAPATRQYRYQRKQIVPWARSSQRYILLNLRGRGLESWLRKFGFLS